MKNLLYKELTYELIGVLFDVHNELGVVFLRSYSDAVEYELKERAIPYEREKSFKSITRTLFYLITFMQILLFLAR